MGKSVEKTAKTKIFEAAGVEVPVTGAEVAVPAVQQVVVSERSTRETRKSQLLEVLGKFDVEELEELKTFLAGLPSLLTETLGEDLVLTERYAHTLLRQALAVRRLKDLHEVALEQIKEVAFDHFNASLAEKGHPDPQHVNATLDVLALGYKLRREGAGYGDPTIDEEKLKEALGSDWKKVYTRTVIPRRVVTDLDEDALWELVKTKPGLLEKIRDSLLPGAPKAGRLNLRNI